MRKAGLQARYGRSFAGADFRRPFLPYSRPYKISLSLSLMGTDEGREHLVLESATLLETEPLFVSISNLAAKGAALFFLFSRIDSRFASWKG